MSEITKLIRIDVHMIHPKHKLNHRVVIPILLLCALFNRASNASDNNRHWVFFKDKGSIESLSAIEKEEIVRNQISEKAIKRRLVRAAQNTFNKISIVHQDLPINNDYVEALKQLGFTIHQKSRWFNAVSGYASDEVLNQISQLPFVKSVERVKRFVEMERLQSNSNYLEPLAPEQSFGNFDFDYGLSFAQADFHNIPQLHNQGLTGSGILIGIFDTGFNLNHPAMQHLVQKVVAEWDFINNDSVTQNEAEDSGTQDWHGSWVLSAMAGMKSGQLVGPAFNANFCLAKTELVGHELNMEEDNWAAAAEWADSIGVDIVSTSLGYSIFDDGQSSYSYSDMDGETTIITRAANYLADRGVIVVSSAGNEGDEDWFHITAPADGKDVLAVGAVNSSNQLAGFSSRGPTADGRIKPDVVGIGVNVRVVSYPDTQGYSGYMTESGTSFSCPIVAGICALVLEKNPELPAKSILEIIRQSGDNAGNPDNNRGWGRVDAVRAIQLAESGVEEAESFSVLPNIHNAFSSSNGSTVFRIGLPEQSPVTISIYNILGQRVKRIRFYGSEGIVSRVHWDGKNENGVPLASGIYPFRVKTNFGEKDSKVMIVR